MKRIPFWAANRPYVFACVFLLVIALASTGCEQSTAETAGLERADGESGEQTLVKRGEYLVTVAVCHDCHTPLVMGPEGPEPDMTRALSGHPQDLPVGDPPARPAEAGIWLWAPHNTAFFSDAGTAYAINLTPDENTGTGIWTEEIFINTLRSGRHWGVSRPILPPMPWPYFRQMTDEDLKAIWAYLRTVPPISNRVPQAVVNQPPPAATTAAAG